MFDNLLREFRKLEQGVKVPVELPLDENGHFDRRCPAAECRADFKVQFEDWKEKVRDEVVYCPVCRHEAQSIAWNTLAQEDYYRRACEAHLHRVVGGALRRDSRQFNSYQPRNGLIQVSLSCRPGTPPIAIPPEAAQRLRQQFTCEACGCRYSSVGAAFFCPACGHNSAVTTFAAAVETVRASVGGLEQIKVAICAAANEDAATDAARQILENSLVRLVASFQRYAEATFGRLPNAAAHVVRKNLFQNLGESSALWRAASGKGYEDLLEPAAMAELVLFFQQRHILAHKEGIVDADYLTKSGDTAYRIGQRLVVKQAAVLRLACLVNELAQALHRLTESQAGP